MDEGKGIGLTPGREVRRGGLSPLWIITLFVSLTEAVLGVGVAQTEGGIQVALTAFVMVFPLVIAGAFFATLWKKAYVFYRPVDYGAEVDPRAFVDALRGEGDDRGDLYATIEDVLQTTVASQRTISEVLSTLARGHDGDAREDLEATLQAVATRAVESIKENGFVTIDARTVPSAAIDEIWEIPYEGHKSVAHFLDEVWVRMRHLVRIGAYTYGLEWVLIDSEIGRPLEDLGRLWARQSGLADDHRPIADVGIRPGSAFVVRVSKDVLLREDQSRWQRDRLSSDEES